MGSRRTPSEGAWASFLRRVLSENVRCDLREFERIDSRQILTLTHGLRDLETTVKGFNASGVVVDGDVDLKGLRFDSTVDLSSSVIEGELNLAGARFHPEGASPRGILDLSDATCGSIDLSDLSESDVVLSSLEVRDRARICDSIFEWPVDMGRTSFGHLDLSRSTFESDVDMSNTHADRSTKMLRTTFRGPVDLTRAQFSGDTDLSWTTFSAVDGRTVSFKGKANLTGVTSSAGTLLLGATGEQPRGDGETERALDALLRVQSLDYSSVQGLLLSNVDLRECTFRNVANIDEIAFEGRVLFVEQPLLTIGSYQPRSRARIREEQLLREDTSLTRRVWLTLGPDRPIWRPASEGDSRSRQRAEASDISKTYRGLRKGREDRKNEPGAADFYYGEMEMRRYSDPMFSRYVVAAYWALSGYSLRPARAVIALLALTASAAAILIGIDGFDSQDPSFWDAWRSSLLGTVGLFTVDVTEDLNARGEWVEFGLRIFGPALYAMIVLAFRGRVRR